MGDPLKQLLLQSGWSYEDVLQKLEQYKTENVIKSETENCSSKSELPLAGKNVQELSEKSTIRIDSVINNNNAIPQNGGTFPEVNNGVICVDVEILSDDEIVDYIPDSSQDQEVPHVKEEEETPAECIIIDENEIGTKPVTPPTESRNKKGITILNHFKINTNNNQRYVIQDLSSNTNPQFSNLNISNTNCDINNTQCSVTKPATIENCDSTMNSGRNLICAENKDLNLESLPKVNSGDRKRDLVNKSDDYSSIKRRKSNCEVNGDNVSKITTPDSFCKPPTVAALNTSTDLIEELNNLFDDVESNSKKMFPAANESAECDDIISNAEKLLRELAGTPVRNEPEEDIVFVGTPETCETPRENVRTEQEPQQESVKMLNLTSNLEKKKHNSRLHRITNVLLEKLQKDGPITLETPQDESDDQDESAVGFQIVNVVGGYKSPEREAEDQVMPKTNESPSVTKKKKMKKLFKQSVGNISKQDYTPIKPTKTNDVTKIKGWKKKKFSTENDLGNVSPTAVTKSPRVDTSNSANAAFTSDILDQFLSENSSLNISYELPKLVAEDTLKQTYIDVQFPAYGQVAPSPTPKPKKEGFKPKTVAEKRRMEEMKFNPIANILENMSTKQQKQCVRETLKIKRKLVSQDLPFTRRCFVTAVRLTHTESSILYCGKQLYVPSCKENKILENIKDQYRKRFRAAKIKQKPSLLRTLTYNFTYDPKDWKNVRLKLPKLFVEVTPQLRKRIHPHVERYVQYDKEVLDEERVAFALSTLKVKDQPFVPQTFVFPVRYKKTKVFRKRKEPKPLPPSTCHESDDVIESGVKEVIERLLDYCEILDQTKDIVLEDEVRVVEEIHPVQEVVDKIANTKSDSPTLKKTEAEMRRLNCKFLSIPTNEDVSSKGPCKKEHCALGCVCSNYSTLLDQSHCGKYKCMFECTCKNRSESNTFSQCVINQLQDEAKKNLAKEEKEFTQTLIKTNNQLILVGDSERRKRKAKVPRRYDDFIESEVLDKSVVYHKPLPLDLPKPKVEPPLVYGNLIIPSCHVKLTIYDFSDIIPYCMVHSLYKCYCRKEAPLSKAISPIKPTVTSQTPLITNEPKENVAVKRKLEQTNVADLQGINTVYNSLETQKITSVVPFEVASPKSRNGMKKKRKKTKQLYTEVDTSRTKGVSRHLLIRNKTSAHLEKIRKSTNEFNQQLHAYMIENVDAILRESETSEMESNATISHQDCDVTLVETLKPPVQEIEIANPIQEKIEEKELKLQRRRRKQKLKQKTDSDYKTKEEMETEYLKFLAKYNSKTRMLPWPQLMSKFESGDYQLWYRICRENSLVTLTENDKRPSPLHINLQNFLKYDKNTLPLERYCNVVRYVIKRQTPSGIPKDKILALVLETKGGIWNICGLCEKNQSSKTDQFTASIIEFYDGVQDIMNDDGREKQSGKSTKKEISMGRKIFAAKSIVPKNDMGNKDKILQVRLPDLQRSEKWLVVPFKIIFSQLCFTRCNGSIGFDEITKATTVACTDSVTIAIKSNRLRRTYSHNKFGVYYDYTNSDKLFIGPYHHTENHDVKFMVYVNSSLVEAQGFFENSSASASHWYCGYVEVTDGDDDVEFVPTSESLIDLTCDSENEDSSYNPNELNSKKSVAQLEEVSQLCEYYKPVGDPRYIVTNITELGYLPAYLHGESLDVVLCPITKTPRRFSNWKIALGLIRRVMAAKLTLVPSDFDLVVSMHVDLDKSKYKLLNKNILNGFYMAGAFGVKCLGNITLGQLNSLEIPQEEKTRLLLLRDRKCKQVLVMQLIKTLNLQVPQGITGSELLKFIAHEFIFKAEVENKRLEIESSQYADEFKALEDTKKVLLEKYKTLISALPESRQKIAEKQLDNILKASPLQDHRRHVRIANGEVINLEDETVALKNSIETIKPPFIIKDITRATVLDASLAKPTANKTPAYVNLTIKKKYSNVAKSPQHSLLTVPHLKKISLTGTSASLVPSMNNAIQTVMAAGNTSPSTTNIKNSVISTSSALHSIENRSVPSMATLTAVSTNAPIAEGSNYIALQNGNKVNLLKLESNNLSLVTKPNTSSSLIKPPSSANR
ncbi:uncharacterized protein LOC116167639 isoform X1 [Photinus pyralis]|uniref:uncharacterized protein LOC116167639 isoform X1 n=1 Tax=Photinus pyralis TaxID=7054 RepID=UPI0012674043|nr:uncharacterized protein LOC116167639 isoform X1 [Photinus pyralis]XP_031338922.1 uncharacterized protein LOC116167639 isoform X1 [Photinus pyralis]XP_031338923.1 uncharacterized protein LOC116167639 isoform X1 [Photinus pyralis]XP_031338924.1 uncharacterized protein LOC116167639 isoform X1 [Photinus pyralis]